jgi:hypothetical protein
MLGKHRPPPSRGLSTEGQPGLKAGWPEALLGTRARGTRTEDRGWQIVGSQVVLRPELTAPEATVGKALSMGELMANHFPITS